MPEIHYTRFTVTCWQQIVVMAFGKRLDTNRHNGLSPAPTCHRLVRDLLWRNWCNGLWP